VLIDANLKPWLLEINHAPSFSTDTPFDFKIKKDVIADAIELLGFSYHRKKKFIKNLKLNIKRRMLQTRRLPSISNSIPKRKSAPLGT
jgi:tubulin polyglutamylase TTLL6/13